MDLIVSAAISHHTRSDMSGPTNGRARMRSAMIGSANRRGRSNRSIHRSLLSTNEYIRAKTRGYINKPMVCERHIL